MLKPEIISRVAANTPNEDWTSSLDERGVPVVFLEGSPTYYRRFGFSSGGKLAFRRPSLRIPDAAFQAIQFSAFEPWMRGTLVYADVFWEQDAVGRREETQVPSPGLD
jgi:putative acetyltransferase